MNSEYSIYIKEINCWKTKVTATSLQSALQKVKESHKDFNNYDIDKTLLKFYDHHPFKPGHSIYVYNFCDETKFYFETEEEAYQWWDAEYPDGPDSREGSIDRVWMYEKEYPEHQDAYNAELKEEKEIEQDKEFCEVGEHYVDKEDHWSNNGYPLCGDCMGCTKEKELEELGLELEDVESSINYDKYPKRSHQMECRCCGDFGWYEDIADDADDDEYGTCGACDESESDNCFKVAQAECPDIEYFDTLDDAKRYCDRHLIDYGCIMLCDSEKKEIGDWGDYE